MILIPNLLVRKITVKHAKAMDTTCCCNPAPVTNRITFTIAGLWAHLPITLRTEPLELMKVPTMDVVIITASQAATLVIVMITEIVTTS